MGEPDSAVPGQDSMTAQPEIAPKAGSGVVTPDFAPHSDTTATESAVIESSPATPPPSGRPETRVEVRPGDTLWSIAQHHLTPVASDADIETAWHAWYSANAAVIGTDPDLIQPGQLFAPPTPETGNSS